MGDDQVVARELERAGARLDEWKDVVAERFRSGEGPHELIALVSAAIEVGRLRALAGVGGEQQAYDAAWEARRAEGHPIDRETHKAFSAGWLAASRHWRAAFAAREEVQG